MASLNDSWVIFGFIGKKLEMIKTLIENNYVNYEMPPCRIFHGHYKWYWLPMIINLQLLI